jgi:hypothetical protein
MALTKDRFVAVPNTDYFILSDYSFWAEHEDELDQWCKKNMCVREGSLITVLNDYARTLFILKWTK